jgi:hypothetical protein
MECIVCTNMLWKEKLVIQKWDSLEKYVKEKKTKI